MFICNFIDNIFILHAISTESGVNLYSTEFVDDEEDREKSPHFFFCPFWLFHYENIHVQCG